MSLRDTLDGEERNLEPTQASVRRGGLRIGQNTHPLVSLSLDFAALPRAQWAELLGSAHALGFRLVDVVVAWERHATADGAFDFGETPELDLPAFLACVHEHGLLASIRPGPRQFGLSASTHFGLPAVVAMDEACLLPPNVAPAFSEHSARPREPDLGSPVYLEKARRWLSALGALLQPARYPRGPVIAAHLEAALALSSYEAAPQSRGRSLAPDWVAEQRRIALDALDQFAKALLQQCPGLPLSVPEFATHSRLKLRFCDVGLQAPPDARRWALAPRGPGADALGGSVPLCDVELTRETRAPSLHSALLCLASGARGLSISPGVGSRSQGCLLTESSEPTVWMHEYAPLIAALERTQFHGLLLEPCVNIVICDRLLDLERMERARTQPEGWLSREPSLASAPPRALPPELVELSEMRQVLAWLEQCLVRYGVPFRRANEWELDGLMGTSPWVVVPTPSSLSQELQETLEYGLRRGLPCSIGPHLPEGFRDERGDPDWPFLLGTTERDVEGQVQALLQQGMLPRREVAPDSARVLVHVQKERGVAVPAVAFVLNTSAHSIEASFGCPGTTARDALTQATVASFAERLVVTVPGQTIRMLELFTASPHADENY